MADQKQYVTLEYDDGKTVETEIVGTFTCGEKEYIALKPTKNDEKDDEVYIFGFDWHEDTQDYDLLDIESDEEFKNAVKAYHDELSE